MAINHGGSIKIKKIPRYTKYLFGDISEIAGKTVHLFERNKQGDCLCLAEKGLVDVDHRDIEEMPT